MLLFPIPDSKHEDLIKKLDAISNIPEQLSIANSLKIEKKGGHLQGIQPYKYKDQTYYYTSGSSTEYGYLVAASDAEVKKLHILRNKPLKHAGGFQIYRKWLAVGIEDNTLRNISEVHVYQLDNPIANQLTLKAIVDRKGDWERATAGAVAIIQWESQLLMLVGDWSNRNIDFYSSPLKTKPLSFRKKSEINLASYNKEGWIDDMPWPYQNINLVNYRDQLLLFGFSSGDEDENLMDVYQVERPFSSNPLLTKIYTRIFPKTKSTRFGWGAGIQYENGNFTIYSCGENILDQFIISRYSSR